VAVALRGSLKEASQRLGLSLDTRELVSIGIVLGVALVLRLYLSQVLGLAGDLTSYVRWGLNLPHQLSTFYTLNPDDNYPPLINFFYAIFDGVYTLSMHVLGVAYPSFDLYTSRQAAVFLRLPFVLSELAANAVL
jgi:hypothetical protein